MKKNSTINAQVHELLYQALETELGGVKIYERRDALLHAKTAVIDGDLAAPALSLADGAQVQGRSRATYGAAAAAARGCC